MSSFFNTFLTADRQSGHGRSLAFNLNNMKYQTFASAFSLLLLTCSAGSLQAHMAWLASDDQGHAILWFGESTEDRTYHMPSNVAGIKLFLDDHESPIGCEPVEGTDLIGLRSMEKCGSNGEISGSVTYGLYHGTKLTYHVEHLLGDNSKRWPSEPREGAVMQSVILPTQDGGVEVTVLKDGKPLADAEVKLFCEEGHEEGAETTDNDGKVRFNAKEVESGLNAILIGHTDEAAHGELNGEAYKSAANYLTSTFFVKRGQEKGKTKTKMKGPEVEANSGVQVKPSGLQDLPEELTSFGAAVAGNRIYVYGGHTGTAHSYSTQEQSNRLWMLDLNSGKDWKKVSQGPRLQGLALIPVQDRVLRLGGFTAMNAEGEEHDLRSQTSAEFYAPADDQWTAATPLPEPRSSFDAAVLNGQVYVVGGWQLGAAEGEKWHKTAWAMDLSSPKAEWKKISDPPFQRRALSVAAFDGKLYAIGGMQEQGGPTTRVAIYDPTSDSWSEGPALPGKGMSGFGSSAFTADGSLYVSTMDGFVHRIGTDEKQWTTVAAVEPARFFHRMLPVGKKQLVLLGGANMEVGKFTDIPAVELTGPSH